MPHIVRKTAPVGKYDWLNRSIFVCSGARYAAALADGPSSHALRNHLHHLQREPRGQLRYKRSVDTSLDME
jgi:hypothetical protein